MPSSGITISNVFAAQTGPIPLSQLDADFTTVANQANTLSAYSNYFVDSSGAPNSITVTVLAPLVFSYVEGVQLQVKLATTNTSRTVNINVNGLGSRLVILYDGNDPAIGSLVTGVTVNLIYDGTSFRLNSQLSKGLFTDGTAASPSISFVSDVDTGIYRISANDMGFTSNGVLQFHIQNGALRLAPGGTDVGQITSTQFQGMDGAAAAPGFSFFGDPNTGLYRITADTVGFSAGGALTFQYDTLGVYNLAGTAANPAYTFSVDSDTGWYRIGANDAGLVTGGVLALEADASQNLFGKGLSVGAIKTADTARSSTITLADDPVLVGIPLAIGKYAVDLWLKPHNVTTSTQGFQFRLNFSGTIASGGYSYLGIANNIAFNAQPVSTYNSTVQFTDITAASNFDYIHATGYVEVTAAGTMAVQWSQRASSANNTILDRGSYARFIRII